MTFYQPSKQVLHIPSSPPSPLGTPQLHCYYTHHGRAPHVEAPDTKVVLRSKLANGALDCLPAGFPFHYSMTGCGSPILTYDSFEFREPLYPGGRRSAATICFRNTAESRSRYFTWSVTLPSHPSGHRREPPKAPDAFVKIDPALLNTSYGRFLRKTPAVILRALSISLELGMPITITTLDKSIAPLMPYARTRNNWHLGDVVYLGTTPDGRQQVLHVTHN